VIVEKPAGKRGEMLRVGIADGRIMPLTLSGGATLAKLKLHDVVMVRVIETKTKVRGKADAKGKRGEPAVKITAQAELRLRPAVQGAVVVLENKTGRILAMTGGFSYPRSQLNRVTQAQRQPGSSIKPLTYLAALGSGLQPNTLVEDEGLTLPPIGVANGRGRPEDYWSPKNYGGGTSGTMTLRRALENSRNLATAQLLIGGIMKKPEDSLNRLCDLAAEVQVYRECMHYYPFVLGAQPVRPIDLAAFYATIANEGVRPSPHVVESIELNGQTIFQQEPSPVRIGSVDAAAFYQLKSILQGVLARGTARSIGALAPFVAGKTGTTDDENDAWFVGFTNDVTVAVWVGYDNAGGKRRTLGGGATGGGLAVPIFNEVIQAVWAHAAPKVALAPPSPEARNALSCKAVDYDSGDVSRRGIPECFRVDANGKIINTQNKLISQENIYARRDDDEAYRARAERYGDWRWGWGYEPWWGQRRWESERRGSGGWGWGGRRW
jgi:membrane carboxypeptidase/penicillin-binding protein